MKASAMHPTVTAPQHAFKPRRSRKPLIGGILVVLVLIGAGSYYAFASVGSSAAISSDIEVKVLDSSNGNARLNGVSVTLSGFSSGASCGSGMTATSTYRANVLTRVKENGLALFQNCATGSTSKKYNISNATLSGYKVNSKTPHYKNKGKFTVFASKTAKKNNKVITLFMSAAGSGGTGGTGGGVTPPPPPGLSKTFVPFQCGAAPALGLGISAQPQLLAKSCVPPSDINDSQG